ncbi:Bud site selection protein bud4 [Apophysomyces sp. BC1034]|nr:Bud site selection protein bud4 [Apophysomyces sp. BC1015]KAG0171051.1 Bud site selection protein bud4 [Apophysomyces sp. BC1021]KAG0188155.1 Bud site selection protein bud4 [Apophysomyces sp. BC1034]
MSVENSLLSEWTKAVENGDFGRIKQLHGDHPKLLWSQLELDFTQDTDRAHLIAQLERLEALGTSLKPLYALQYVLLDHLENSNEETSAAQEARTEILSYFIKHTRADDLNTRYWGCNNTTLHLASFLDQPQIVVQLLDKGASPNIPNDMGHFAKDVCQPGMLHLLEPPDEDVDTDEEEDEDELSQPQQVQKTDTRTRPNYATNDRFKQLRQLAESPAEKKSVVDRQNSTRRYFRPGHVEEKKKKVLNEEEAELEKQRLARQQEVAKLAQKSAVKNNPLLKKLEQQQTQTPTQSSAKSVGALQKYLAVAQAADHMKRHSKVISSLQNKSYVSSSVFRQASADTPSARSLRSPSPAFSEYAEDIDAQREIGSGEVLPQKQIGSETQQKEDVKNDQHSVFEVLKADGVQQTMENTENTTELKPEEERIEKVEQSVVDTNSGKIVMSEEQHIDTEPQLAASTENDEQITHKEEHNEQITHKEEHDEQITHKEEHDEQITHKKEHDDSTLQIMEDEESEKQALFEIQNDGDDDIPQTTKDADKDLPAVIKEESSNNASQVMEKAADREQNIQHQPDSEEVNNKIFSCDATQLDSEERRGSDIPSVQTMDKIGDVEDGERPIRDSHDNIDKGETSESLSNHIVAAEDDKDDQPVDDKNRNSHASLQYVQLDNNNNQATFHISEQSARSSILLEQYIDNIEDKDKATHEAPEKAESKDTLPVQLDELPVSNEKSQSITVDDVAEEENSIVVAAPSTETDKVQNKNEQEVNQEHNDVESLHVVQPKEEKYGTQDVQQTHIPDESPDLGSTELDGDSHAAVAADESPVQKRLSQFANSEEARRLSGSQRSHWSSGMHLWENVIKRESMRSDRKSLAQYSESDSELWFDSNEEWMEHEEARKSMTMSLMLDNNEIETKLAMTKTTEEKDISETPSAAQPSDYISAQEHTTNIGHPAENTSEKMETPLADDEADDTQPSDNETVRGFVMHRNIPRRDMEGTVRMSDETSVQSPVPSSFSSQRLSTSESIDTWPPPSPEEPEQKAALEEEKEELACGSVTVRPTSRYIRPISRLEEEAQFMNTASAEEIPESIKIELAPADQHQDKGIPEVFDVSLGAQEVPVQAVTSTHHGKLYVHVSGAHNLLLPLPKEITYVRCVVSDGRYEYMSRYEVLGQEVLLDYECIMDAVPDMIVTVALHVRPDYHVKPRTGFSSWFTSIRKQKESLSGYVHPDDGAIGQARFALAHMQHACHQKVYQASFDCFNSWYARTSRERQRRQQYGAEEDVLKVVGNLSVEMLYLPVSDPTLPVPRNLRECDLALKIRQWHETCWQSGYLSTRPQSTLVWERRYYRLIGSQFIGYASEEQSWKPVERYDIADAVRLSVAAEQTLVTLVDMPDKRVFQPETICDDNRRGFFRLAFPEFHVDCVCDQVDESEEWVKALRSMIGRVPLKLPFTV